MAHELTRIEELKNGNNQDEVFCCLLITDDLGTYEFGHWLTAAELVIFKASYGNIHTIMASYLDQARALKIAADNAPEPAE